MNRATLFNGLAERYGAAAEYLWAKSPDLPCSATRATVNGSVCICPCRLKNWAWARAA